MWLPNVEVWSDNAKQVLLRTDIERRLTIDRFYWNSLFVYRTTRTDDGWEGTAPGYSLSIPPESRTSDSFWDDDEDMMDFIRQHSEVYQQPFWEMAFSVVRTPKYDRYLSEYLEAPKSEHVPVPVPLDVHPRQKSE